MTVVFRTDTRDFLLFDYSFEMRHLSPGPTLLDWHLVILLFQGDSSPLVTSTLSTLDVSSCLSSFYSHIFGGGAQEPAPNTTWIGITPYGSETIYRWMNDLRDHLDSRLVCMILSLSPPQVCVGLLRTIME